jgi:hypothetical protein
MKNLFKDEIETSLNEITRRFYNPLSDPFFSKLIEPSLEERWHCCISDREAIMEQLEVLALEVWYEDYLSERLKKRKPERE